MTHADSPVLLQRLSEKPGAYQRTRSSNSIPFVYGIRVVAFFIPARVERASGRFL